MVERGENRTLLSKRGKEAFSLGKSKGQAQGRRRPLLPYPRPDLAPWTSLEDRLDGELINQAGRWYVKGNCDKRG